MATVRYLQECIAASGPGWTELLARPTPPTPSLSHTVLGCRADADTAPLRAGDVDAADLRQGNHQRRRPAQPPVDINSPTDLGLGVGEKMGTGTSSEAADPSEPT